MRKCFLISYDLLSADKNYTELYEQIKALGLWWHYLESVWIVSTTQCLKDIQIALKGKMDDKDNLLIVDITGRDRSGWLVQKAWDWMNENNPRASV